MKNHTIITKITEIHQLWRMFHQNGIIYLEKMGKIVPARFIRSWALKKQQEWLQESNVYEVRKKSNTERMIKSICAAVNAGGLSWELLKGFNPGKIPAADGALILTKTTK
ncbi:MAG: hypothetical protein KAU20_03830 [Nanoarchaeota archaeon]|nr:hypothetical protein [Nanoarchaeota archaeon]